MTKLSLIEGIGPVYKEKLQAVGVRTVETLRQIGGTPEGRKELAEKTGIGDEYILDWVNRADLMRITGIGEEYSDLLECAGVDTVVELAQRNPSKLYGALLDLNEEKHLVRRPPSHSMVTRWIAEAKTLPRGVSY